MNKIGTNSGVLVVLDRDARIPLHRQIETSIRDSIRAGRLPRGSSLPPSRVLAADLGVSRGVVVEAYQQGVDILARVMGGTACTPPGSGPGETACT
jgi:GntR family transcriptional regulator/MocR family aminotransferase